MFSTLPHLPPALLSMTQQDRLVHSINLEGEPGSGRRQLAMALHGRGIGEKRHLLLGVVRALVGRVVAVVSGDDQQVISLKLFKKDSQLLVKPLQLLPITPGISPVPPQGVKIHQIYETKSLKVLVRDLNGLLHAVDAAL